MSAGAGDAIAAIGTGRSASAARSVVRVSGVGVVGRLHPAVVADALERSRGVRRVRVVVGDAAGHWVWGVAVVMPGPGSFTGEDVVELIVPGAGVVAERVLGRVLLVDGVRHAGPGEFAARAYLNGRMSVEEAEGVAAAIAARGEAELVAAERVMSGDAGAAYRAAADEIAACLSLVEAGIDFTEEEDVVAIGSADLVARVEAVRGELGRWIGGGGAVERSSAVVAMAGVPNAGKSTLFNALVGRRRSVVSDTPGTTRDAVREEVALGLGGGEGGASVWDPVAVELIDPAGVDASIVGVSAAEAGGQAASVAAVGEADVVVWCDPTGRFDEAQRGVLGIGASAAVVRVRTKADLVGPGGGDDGGGVLGVCALDGSGVAALRRAIADAAAGSVRVGGGDTVLPRHGRALARCNALLGDAAELARRDAAAGERHLSEAELVADRLRGALDAVGEVAGAISPDDVIGRVFAMFCVGK